MNRGHDLYTGEQNVFVQRATKCTRAAILNIKHQYFLFIINYENDK